MNATLAKIWADMGSNVGIVMSGLRCGRRSWPAMIKCAEDYFASGAGVGFEEGSMVPEWNA